MPGMMKKGMMKYQEGGPVRSPGKRRIMEGGPKGLPMMTPDQLRQAREAMTPEERRDYSRGATVEDARNAQRYKKGGKVMAKAPVKKKAGGVVKKAKGGMIGKGCK